MKKLLNTLYVTIPETYIRKDHETIVIQNGKAKLGQFPARTIGNIVCFGRVSVSPFLMGYCGDMGIGLAFFNERNRFMARVHGRQSGNVRLRRSQYRWADDDKKISSLARMFVAAKISNCRSVLMREVRNHGPAPTVEAAIKSLASGLRYTRHAALSELLGIEGAAANAYFDALGGMIKNDGFIFEARVRRPPTDPVNALLSLAYALLANECSSALEGVGLDPQVGYLHRDRPGRASLALDLLEEFRSPWADRFVLTLLNRKEVQSSDFVTEATGAVRLKDDARKMFLSKWQERKLKEVRHGYLEESVPVGLLPHCQAMLLARHIRGDTEHYTPYLAK